MTNEAFEVDLDRMCARLIVLAPMAAQAQDLQQKLAAAKEAAALNQKALRSYSWLEKTELSLKGEVKSTKVDMCRYGPGRQGAEDPVVEPPPPEKKRGLKGKMIAKKTGGDERRSSRQRWRSSSNASRLPRPDAGGDECRHRVDLSGGPRPRIAQVPGLRQGERRADADVRRSVKSLRQIDVNTWLDEPENAVTLKVTMAVAAGR